jgi:hypothetical protein
MVDHFTDLMSNAQSDYHALAVAILLIALFVCPP